MNMYNDLKEFDASKETVNFTCMFIHKTDRAVLIEYDGRKMWVPTVAVVDIQGAQKQQYTVQMEVQEWIAIEKEII